MDIENPGNSMETAAQQATNYDDQADEFDRMEIPAFEIIEEPTDPKVKEEHIETQIEPAKKPMDKETQRLFWVKESLKTYSLLKKNMFLDRKKKVVNEDDILVCNCIKCDPELLPQHEKYNRKVSYNCGDGCLNRMVCYECEEDSCPCGEYCRNRRFQLHQNADVYPFPYEGKGWGLRAGSDIKKGQFVMQYIGEIFNINSEEGQIRNEAYSKSTCTYLMKIGGNEVIDPTFKGNMARFINHSCKPNCVTQKWHVLGEVCVGIFTLTDLKVDEELTFDYQFDIFKTPLTKCLCGTAECKGYLGVIPQDHTWESWNEKLANMPCSICGQSTEDDEDKLLVCEICNEGFHTFCLDPPLTKIPKGSWYCTKCALESKQLEKKKKEEAQRAEPAWQMNKKLYDIARKKRGKGPDLNAEKRLKKLMAEEDENEKKMKGEDLERYEQEYNLHKRLEKQAVMEMHGMKPEEAEDFVPIRRLRKESIKTEPKKSDKAEKTKEKKTAAEKKQAKRKTSDMPIEEPEETTTPAPETQMNPLAVQKTSSSTMGTSAPVVELTKGKNFERELKDMALELFKKNLEEDPRFSKQLADFEDNGNNELDRNTLLVNSLELEVVKKNQQVLHKIGVTIFWDSPFHGYDYGDVFRKNYELTVNGNKKQMEIFDSFISLVLKSAATVEKAKGNVEAIMMVPAIYLRRLIGQSHQTLNDFEKVYNVMIQYEKNFVNDECYPMTKMTELKIKGQKEDIKKCYGGINALISKLTTVRLFYSQTEIYTIISHLPYLKRMVQPTEFRINRDFSLKELAHPFFYMKYKDKEVALVGTPEYSLSLFQMKLRMPFF